MKNEGNPVGKASGKTLEQCKELCNQNEKCHSLAFGTNGGQCYLKDKCILPKDAKKLKNIKNFRTYYKQCDPGKILLS